MNFVDKDGTTKVYIPVHPWKSQGISYCLEGGNPVYNFSWAKPGIVSRSKTGFELRLDNIFEVRKPV